MAADSFIELKSGADSGTEEPFDKRGNFSWCMAGSIEYLIRQSSAIDEGAASTGQLMSQSVPTATQFTGCGELGDIGPFRDKITFSRGPGMVGKVKKNRRFFSSFSHDCLLVRLYL